jgi:hypothetical protein
MFDCLAEKIKDYSRAVVYKIVCKDTCVSFVYVGSTSNYRMRLSHHKSDYFNVSSPRHKLPLYEFMRANGDWTNFEVIIVEEFPCSSKRELEEREQYWKVECGDNMGLKKAHITKEQIKEEAHKHYIENREQRLQQAKEYYEANKEKKRKYYEVNKERILENSKKRYNQKQKISKSD